MEVMLPPGTADGLSNVTLCSTPELFTHVTVEPRVTVTAVGKKVEADMQNCPPVQVSLLPPPPPPPPPPGLVVAVASPPPPHETRTAPTATTPIALTKNFIRVLPPRLVDGTTKILQKSRRR